VISSISLPQRRRHGVAGRLLSEVGADLTTFRRGLLRDLRALAVDTVAWYAAVAVLVSQFLDALTTVIALANNSPEANPLTAAMIARWGLPGLVCEKAVISTVVVWNMARLRGRGAVALGLCASLVGVAAAAWNLHLVV
jgi:hypothetical protein